MRIRRPVRRGRISLGNGICLSSCQLLSSTPFSPLDLSPALWLKADAGLVTDGAAAFASASSQSLSVASNSTLHGGSGDWWFAGWVKFDSVAGAQAVAGKFSIAGNQREWILALDSVGPVFRLYISGDGAATTVITTVGSPSTGTWYFVLAWYDSTNQTLNLKINNQATNTTAYSSGTYVGTAPFKLGNFDSTYYLAGTIDSAAYGKAPSGGIAGVISAINTALYNGGSGVRYSDLSSAQKTAWGLVSWYDFAAPGSGLVADSHGTNTLTNNNSVSYAAGIVSGTASADGDPVTTWQDQSGNARHASAPTSGRRPTLKLAIQGGLPIVRFDGVDDALVTASMATFPSKRGTVWAVFKNPGVFGNQIVGTYNGTHPYWIFYFGNTFRWNDDITNHAISPADPSDFFTGMMVRDGDTSLKCYIDGSLTQSLTIANNQPADNPVYLANDSGGNATAIDIAELALFPTALNTTQLAALQSYSVSKWGLT